MTGLGRLQLRTKLEALQMAGRLRIGRKMMTALDGTSRPVPAYWIE